MKLKRLKRELEKVTAERDLLLANNRRLIQTTKDHADSSLITGSNPASYTSSSTNTIKIPNSSPLLNINSSGIEKIQLFRSLFTDVKMYIR